MISNRPISTSPELQTKEIEWWEKFAEVEDKYCWVQPAEIQEIIRADYVREIIRTVPKGGRILDLGCGAGWLCVNLAKFGAEEVWGIDFSANQIALAQANAARAGVAEKIKFICGDATEIAKSSGLFDCLLLHAFLHHLDRTEIERTLECALSCLKPGGLLIIFEPVMWPEKQPGHTNPWEVRLGALARLANRGQRLGFRKMGSQEKESRALIGSRNWGTPPHGVSPKEMPFAPGELETILDKKFEVVKTRHCMAIAHLVMQEWLLRQLSHPISTRLAIPFVARLAAFMERHLLSSSELPTGRWIFEMFVCNLRPTAAADSR